VASLRDLVAGELSTPVDPRVVHMAQAIAAKHGASSRAVLFYGSCLRERQLEGLMLDFYLIVSDYRAAYDRRWLATANRLVPPNVFLFEHEGLTAKFAVLSQADFERECGPDARNVSTAARFAQPSRLAWSADPSAERWATDTIANAAPTLLGWTLPLAPSANVTDLWKRAFGLTYRAELRAERSNRSVSIVESDRERYERVGRSALKVLDDSQHHQPRTADGAKRWWRKMQRRGRWYSVPRLAKGSITFAGGADYIAWKINRHAGTDIHIKPWQRRWPLLAAISLLPRLLRSGAVR
jgi:hypothetical protein